MAVKWLLVIGYLDTFYMDKYAILEKLARHPARLEPLLAELLESGLLHWESMVLRPRSLFTRAYSNDVMGYEVKKPPLEQKKSRETVFIDVCREGFYDMLPEFFFHGPEVVSGYKNLDQRLKESEKVREEEEQARLFFLPFEQAFFRQKLALELEERRLLSGFSNPIQHAIFEQFLAGVLDTESEPDNVYTDPRQKKGAVAAQIDLESETMLFYLLPLAYKIAGRRDLMTTCFGMMLGETVRLVDLPGGFCDFDKDLAPCLGKGVLGVDFVTDGAIEEEFSDLGVYIGPVDLSCLPDYIEGGPQWRLLELLYDYFVPAEMAVQTHILLKQPEAGFVLNAEKASARLAYSTFI